MGAVLNPGSLQFATGWRATDYVRAAGGTQRFADPGRAFVVLPNGQSTPAGLSAPGRRAGRRCRRAASWWCRRTPRPSRTRGFIRDADRRCSSQVTTRPPRRSRSCVRTGATRPRDGVRLRVLRPGHLAAAAAAARSLPARGGAAARRGQRLRRRRPDRDAQRALPAGRDAWRPARPAHQRHFWFVNFQALPFLEATFRLDRAAGRDERARHDHRPRLRREDAPVAGERVAPGVAVGLQDFIGTGLYAGEYVVASKRFGPWTLTLGLGWGRLGTGADIGNPLAMISPRFARRGREVGEGGTPQFRRPVPRRARRAVRRPRVDPADVCDALRRAWRGCARRSKVRRRAARRARRLPRAHDRPARRGGVAAEFRPAMESNG